MLQCLVISRCSILNQSVIQRSSEVRHLCVQLSATAVGSSRLDRSSIDSAALDLGVAVIDC